MCEAHPHLLLLLLLFLLLLLNELIRRRRAVGMWGNAFSGVFQVAVGRVGNSFIVFQAFHSYAISTAIPREADTVTPPSEDSQA